MAAEYVTAISAFLTFLVIAISAIAALVQLRHIRASNQLTGLLRYTEWWETPAMQDAIKYVRCDLDKRLSDRQYFDELMRGAASRVDHPELVVCDWVEQAGSYIKFGLIAEDQFLDLAGGFISSIWDRLEPVVAIRRVSSGPAVYENFEYLAVRSRARLRAHAAGNYPAGSARLMSQERAKSIVEECSAKLSR